jgi:ABC-type transport system involved in multi-copper enzyme maturation permease subunit
MKALGPAGALFAAPPAPARASLLPFLAQEYLRIMRGRVALVIWAMMLWALVAVPFIMARPQPELVAAVASWLGAANVEGKLVLFMWVDASMNKFAVVLGPALAGGIIVDERARGGFDLLAAKPIAGGDYFTVKLAAAGAAMATFYAAGIAGALATFPWRVETFAAGDFAALSAVHLFAALFAVAFAGLMAVVFRRKLAGMLASVAVLGTLVGLAFLGFIYPDFYSVSHLNPFFVGIRLIGSVDRYGAWDVALPILILIAFCVATAWIGRARAAAVFARD